MARLDKSVQTAECVEVKVWATKDYKGNPVDKKIGVFRLDNQEFEVFQTRYFLPEKGAFYTPFLTVKTVAKPFTDKVTGEIRAFTQQVVVVNWEKVGG